MTEKEVRDCPFCSMPANRIVLQDALVFAVRDAYPISPGHTLIIPRRHVASVFEVDRNESSAMLALLGRARELLDSELGPDGYNIGINDGEAAGQTIMHVHIHLIPRFLSDCADPRGGVRKLFPDKADYWER